MLGFSPSSGTASTESPELERCKRTGVKKKTGSVFEDAVEEDYDYIDDCTKDASSVCGNRPENGYKSTGAFPKIHINGYGESSGRKAWLSMLKLIATVYDLFELSQENDGSGTMMLPPKIFPEFAGRKVSWKSFCEDVRDGEMNKYAVPISVVASYEKDAMAAVEQFKREVIDKNYSVSDADIILSTCHAAKGMEWEYVEVLDDFIDLANYQCDHREQNRGFQSAKRQKCSSRPWKFGFASWGDDLNLAYVAVTRAQYKLSVSPFLMKCIRDFDEIPQWKAAQKATTTELPFIEGLARREQQVTPEALEDIHRSLVQKFRTEVGVEDGCLLVEYLLRHSDPENLGVKIES